MKQLFVKISQFYAVLAVNKMSPLKSLSIMEVCQIDMHPKSLVSNFWGAYQF